MSMARLIAIVLLGAALVACQDPLSTSEPAPALGARSAHGLVVMGEDGEQREVLLTGVAGPDADLHPDAATTARAVLDQLIEGRSLDLSEAGEADRYGRIPVQARLPDGRDLAAALVEAGWAIVWPRQGQSADFEALYDAETRARGEASGAWGRDIFTVFGPDPNRLAQHLDSAVIVRGRIVSTGEARNGRIYLNFGLNWRDDMTISASRSTRDMFENAEILLENLDGAVIEARGWLYAENGPMIALTHKEQLAIIDAPMVRDLP